MARKNFGNAEFVKTMNDISEKSVMTANAKTAVDLPIEMIDPNPDNEIVFSMDNIQFLADSIKENGFYGAIDVYKKSDGRYEISAGHRRFQAVKLLGWSTIPALIENEPDEITKRRKLLLSNLNNRELTTIERMHIVLYEKETALKEIAAKKGVKIDPKKCNPAKDLGVQMREVTTQIGKTLGMSSRSVERYIALSGILKEFLPLLENGQLSYSVGAGIAVEPEEVQQIVYDMMAADGKVKGVGSSEEDPAANQILGTYAKFIIESAKRKLEAEKIKNTRIEQVRQTGKTTIDKRGNNLEKKVVVVQEESEPDEELPADKEYEYESETENNEPAALETLNYEEEPVQPEETEPEKPKNYIDRTCMIYAAQLKIAVKYAFEIENKETVKQSLEDIKAVIKKIEEKL